MYSFHKVDKSLTNYNHDDLTKVVKLITRIEFNNYFEI